MCKPFQEVTLTSLVTDMPSGLYNGSAQVKRTGDIGKGFQSTEEIASEQLPCWVNVAQI